MRIALCVLLICGGAVISRAGVVGKNVEYSADGIPLKGYLAYDDSAKEPRPGNPCRP